MASGILPNGSFPADEDRHEFGTWLSGFTDGEGCFHLGWIVSKRFRPNPNATFVIALRRDDEPILATIQSFWQCGRLYRSHRTMRGKKNFVSIYSVQRIDELARVIVPHFERFRLRAKKRLDYLIWKEAVNLIIHRDRSGLRRYWKDDEYVRFTSLHDALKEQRQIDAPPSSIPPPLPAEEDFPLFQQ